MEIAVKIEAFCGVIFIVVTIESQISESAVVIALIEDGDQFLLPCPQGLGIHLKELVFGSCSYGKNLSEESLHIDLVGDIEIFHRQSVQVHLGNGLLTLEEVKTQVLSETVVAGTESETPVIALVEIVFNIIPGIVAQNKIKGGNIIGEQQTVPGKVYQGGTLIQFVVVQRHPDLGLVLVLLQLQHQQVAFLKGQELVVYLVEVPGC